MAVSMEGARGLHQPERKHLLGPVTRARQNRTFVIYAAMVLIGLAPTLLEASAGWRAAGLGLWAPGAGFVALGGWWTLLFPLTLVLFGASLVAWFWAGVVVAPPTVWLGAAALAGAMAGETSWALAPHALAAGLALFGGWLWSRARSRHVSGVALARESRAALPAAIVAADAATEQAIAAAPEERVLAPDQLALVRYCLDRALQPVGAFGGFNIIDQFQPAALRYQINHLGFTLAQYQGAYAPNFRGYLREAQRNLIEKYLERKVWSYWVYESCWGHLNFSDFDPAQRDNIMLTGWFGMHVGQYMINSGDRRYMEPGSLTFRLNSRTAYEHDFNTLIGSVRQNYERCEDEFCLYPCEPNWIYPICNHYGMCALAASDTLHGGGLVKRFAGPWFDKLEAEFTDSAGEMIGLRSELTGIEFPFPVPPHQYAVFMNVFAPEQARLLWAKARPRLLEQIREDDAGDPVFEPEGASLDPGVYKADRPAVPAMTARLAAREFGDDLIAAAAARTIAREGEPQLIDGAMAHAKMSNIVNADIARGAILRFGDFRRSFAQGPGEAALRGPMLTGVDYPDTLVARAISDGEDLRLTLYPGRNPGKRALGFEQLQPNAVYAVEGVAGAENLRANGAGEASLEAVLTDRLDIRLKPAATA